MKTFKISNLDIGMPAILAGAGILTLVICLFLLLPGREAPDEYPAIEDALSRMESRIAALESRMDAVPAPMDATEAPAAETSPDVDAQFQSIAEALAGIQKKIDYIDKRQGNLEQRVVALSAAGPEKAASSKRTAAAAPKKEASAKPAAATAKKAATPSSAKYHSVAAGETRYGIARKYGLTVEQLDRINGFSSGSIIQPGQKILIQK